MGIEKRIEKLEAEHTVDPDGCPACRGNVYMQHPVVIWPGKTVSDYACPQCGREPARTLTLVITFDGLTEEQFAEREAAKR